uniref:Tumor necrosis factor receptor superfamily member 5 n=1 Tax=Pseudonaja textilis TaxID=8673 RepID=A0A670ZUU4_PSETE
ILERCLKLKATKVFLLFCSILQLYLQVKPSCSSEQQYEYSGRCCTKCEPGKYMAKKCTAFSETVCKPCGSNEYMDIWNEEEKCFLHKICDRGRALIEVIPGNSTFKRQCACTAGYHWNRDCDCCRRNTKCSPGSGVKFPIQQDKNTVCVPCPTGYFSNVSSATDACKETIYFFSLQDSSCDTFVNTNVAHPAGIQLLGETYLLDLDQYGFPDEVHHPCDHLLSEKDGPDQILYGSRENFPALFLTTISEDGHFRQMPMEDEYTDKVSNGQHYLPLVSQSDSKPASPFSEPLEVGENDSLNYFFTGTEKLEELVHCCCLDTSCAMDPIHASSHKYLQSSCNHSTCAKMRDVDNEDTGTSLLMSEEKHSFARSPCRQPPNKLDNATDSLKENGSALLGTCGNVTGNGNSTFISSGQVMNFKGEIIFVYVSQNSQEGSMTPGSSDDSLGNPVQEENLNRCETFAGNADQYKEKCAEINMCYSMESGEPQSTVEGYKRTFGPIGQENCESQKKHTSHEASQPVQEEGKPGYS